MLYKIIMKKYFTFFIVLCVLWFLWKLNCSQISLSERYSIVIKELHIKRIIPYDVHLEGKFGTNFTTDNRYVFYGTTTNTLFLTEKKDINYINNVDRIKWTDQRKFNLYKSSKNSRENQIKMLNDFIREAKINLECTIDTPFYSHSTESGDIWLVVDGENLIVIYLGY